MDLNSHSDLHDEQGTSPVSSPSQMITPTKSTSRGLLSDLTGWPSYSDMCIQVAGSQDSDSSRLHYTGETPSGMAYARGAFQKTTHLPTPQSPGNMASYLLTRTPSFVQELRPNIDLSVLPTEFRSHASPSPPSFRPHSIPTPESSPLITRSRNNGPYVLSQIARASSNDENGSPAPAERDGLRSRASTPPRTPSRQTSTRPVTPVPHSRPTTPIQRRLTEDLFHKPFDGSVLHSSDSTNSLSCRVKDESGGEVADIPARLIENYLASTQTPESHRPHSFKRARRSTPTSSAGGASASLTFDFGGKDTSLLWSSVNVGITDTPAKGKRTALFQETSEESFEECLMAGGYGRYQSDRSWKLDEDADSPNQLGDAIGEDGPSSGMVLTEEEKRKKNRLAAFLDPPRSSPSVTPLFPVEIEGRGRVLMNVEPSEPQAAPKPTPKTKRSRKRKKVSADMKQDMDGDSIAAPENRTVDEPNWPDAEFPWRSHPMAQDNLSNAEREERLRYIERFLERDSDEDDVEERRSSSSRHSPDEVSQPGGGKMYPLLTHSKGRRRGSTMLSVVSSDPADAKIALLSKKSIRAVQLRLLRRRRSTSDDGEALCICRGWDDGRPLVQCDACQTWYHLECIGIQSASELGREEDPWFCANCVEVKTPPLVVAHMSEPTFVRTDDGEHGVSGRGSADPEGYGPPFLNAGLDPSPTTPWTRSAGPPMTPPRMQSATQTSSGTSWEEAPSSSSRASRGPRTPQFDTASAFGDMARVYGAAPGRSLESSSSTAVDDSPFDPTSTPSRGIRFGLPFATPKDGRWESSSWQGGRGSVHELLHTPKHPLEDVSWRSGQPLHYHGRVEGFSHEGPSRMQGVYRTGTNNVTPIERDGTVGPRWMQGLESPLGAKRPRRTVDS